MKPGPGSEMPRAKTAFRAEKEHFHTPGQAQQMTEGMRSGIWLPQMRQVGTVLR